MRQILFIPSIYNVRGPDRRLWEMQKAEERSHAARMAHKNRKLRLMDMKRQWRLPKQIPNASGLDPFVELALDLSVAERQAVQSYLMSVPHQIYGTASGSMFCPVRDFILRTISSNDIWLSWILLYMLHQQRIRAEDSSEVSCVLFKRRQHTYRLMNNRIGQEDTAITDCTLYGLAFASLAEDQCGDRVAAQKHLDASLAIMALRKQRGMWEPQCQIANVFFYGFISFGTPRYFKTLKELRTAFVSVARSLTNMQNWISGLRRAAHCANPYSDALSGSEEAMSTNHSNAAFLHTFTSAFATGSLLNWQLHATASTTKESDLRMNFASFFSIINTIWACRRSECYAIDFLQTLEKQVALCVSQPSENKDAEGRVRLTTVGLMCLVLDQVTLLQTQVDNQRIKLNLLNTVTFVEIVMLVGSENAQLVKTSLMSWLLNNLEEELVAIDIGGMKQEIESGWLAKQNESGVSGL